MAEKIAAWVARKDLMVLRYGRKGTSAAHAANTTQAAADESKEVIALKGMWFGKLGDEDQTAKRKRTE